MKEKIIILINIVLICYISDLVSGFIPVPSSIIGMFILFISLKQNWVSPSKAEEVTKPFLNNMSLFFVPLGVGLMELSGLSFKDWGLIVLLLIISCIVVMAGVSKYLDWRLKND